MAAGTSTSEPGLLLLEHLNLNVMSTEESLKFYEALGCARDERRPMNKTLHANCGALTQFHTPSPENEAYIGSEGAQRWRGSVELLYADGDSLAAAEERLGALGFPVSEHVVAGLHGNEFLLRVADAAEVKLLGTESGARPGSEKSSCVGMRGATLNVPPGTAEKGARFYETVLGFATERLSETSWAVCGGPGKAQRLVLKEEEKSTGKEVGEHMAIYIGDYEGCFNRLLERGLIFVNPRFKHLDASTNLEEALRDSCFRFKNVVDLETGQLLFELEHEVRNVHHKSCPLKVVEEA